MHCQIRSPLRKEAIELIVPDMAGESLLEEVEHPHTYIGIRRFLSKCTGAIVLVDAAEMAGGTRDQDYFAMKLVTYLSELSDDGGRTWRRSTAGAGAKQSRPLRKLLRRSGGARRRSARGIGGALPARGLPRTTGSSPPGSPERASLSNSCAGGRGTSSHAPADRAAGHHRAFRMACRANLTVGHTQLAYSVKGSGVFSGLWA